MSEAKHTKQSPNIIKSILIVLLLFLAINFAFELVIEIIESQFPISLYQIFPFTRVAILIATIYGYRRYIRRKHDGVKS